ncbi:hypothetical protein [Streptomyces sp. NPDC051569]|uniref:hypothetical protein n=1 Tax=Streptomyces sp. NPDC051569 TaxID=3365661 RepID=UPI0037A5DDAA
MPDLDAATRWLCDADPDQDHARRWLATAKRTLLPLGRHWSAIRVADHEGLTAARTVTGPSIYDPAGRSVYFLVPVDTTWTAPATELLGDTCYLTVPLPSVTEPPGPHWLRPPTGTGQLVDADLLQTALGLGREGEDR